MIFKIYPNPNAVVEATPTVLYPTQSGNPLSSTWSYKPTDPMAIFYAEKKGVSVEEFIKRDNIIRKEAARCTYGKGSIVYPHTKVLFEALGKVVVRGIYRTYNEYEDVWPDSDFPYVVTAHVDGDPNHTIICTVDYLSLYEPKE